MTYRIYKMDMLRCESMMETMSSARQAEARFEDWCERYGTVAAIFMVNDRGVILASNVSLEDSDDYCEADNLEAGFDPYEGCYTYDC